jgi:hypothetical protein
MDAAPLGHAVDGASATLSKPSVAVGTRGVVLVLTAGAAALVWGLCARLTSVPWIFPDELLYSEVAKSLAAGDLPSVRGVTSFDYGVLYPALIAPAWLAADIETAYGVARWINAVLMAFTVVPVYLLACRFTSTRKAMLVAGFAVGVPSMAYVGTLMTEVALYPAVAFALLAMTSAVERPTAWRQAAALGAIVVAVLVKPLAVVLVAAYVAAVVVYRLGGPRSTGWRTELGAYRLTWGVLACGIVAVLAGGLAIEGDPIAVLGAYAVAAGHVDPLGTARWFVGNLSALALYVAVLPFAATLAVILKGLFGRADDRTRLFAAVAAPTLLALVLAVAAFGSEAHAGAAGFAGNATPLRERNFFVVAPLLLIGLALWTELRDRRGALTWAALGGSLFLVVIYPWGHVPRAANPQNLASLPYLVAPSEHWRAIAAIVVALLALSLLRWGPHGKPGYVWIALGGWFALAGLVAVAVFVHASHQIERALPADHPGWIDALVPSGESVSVLWSEKGGEQFARVRDEQRIVWLNEFFNRRIGKVHELGPKMPYNLPAERVRLRRGAVVDSAGEPVRVTYLLVHCPTTVDGSLVADDARSGARVYRVAGDVRLSAVSRPC